VIVDPFCEAVLGKIKQAELQIEITVGCDTVFAEQSLVSESSCLR